MHEHAMKPPTDDSSQCEDLRCGQKHIRCVLIDFRFAWRDSRHQGHEGWLSLLKPTASDAVWVTIEIYFPFACTDMTAFSEMG